MKKNPLLEHCDSMVRKAGEAAARGYLTRAGYRIVDCNFRTRFGEIDIIAQAGEYLVFVEVKYRADASKGNPLEAVGPAKQERVRRTAAWYLMKKGISQEVPCRFDVVGILGKEIVLVADAF